MPVLSQIYIYPVKSLGGIRVERWPVDRNGLRYDRKWMLIDRNGLFLSQRRLPKMALIKTRIDADSLLLSAPGQTDLVLPLDGDAGDDVSVEIWNDYCLAKTVGAQADAWFSGFLNADCRLVYHPDDRVRPVDPDYARAGDRTAFSDGFPFLIVSEASLQELNRAMALDLSMLRFRPNLVAADCAGFAEDYWRQIAINGISFRLPKPCSRCSVPAINPDTAETGKEPLTTLNRLRRWQDKVYFGQNALHDNTGMLSAGDEIVVVQSGDRQPPL